MCSRRQTRVKEKEERKTMLPRWLDISVDKLMSNRILLRGGGRKGETVGRTGNILDTKRRRKVIENRSGLASSEAQLFRVFLRRSDVPLSLSHLPDKPAPSSWIRHIYSFATGAINRWTIPRLSRSSTSSVYFLPMASSASGSQDIPNMPVVLRDSTSPT